MSNLTPFNSAFGLTQVGPQVLTDGSNGAMRSGKTGEVSVGDAHPRFYEAAVRGNVFCGGLAALTSISNATFTVGSLANTTTPIVGVWNPTTSGKNLVLIQAVVQIAISALTNTGTGGLAWAASTGNGAISTGAQPHNQFTFVAGGSVAKDMSNAALTGVTNVPAVFRAAMCGGGGNNSFSQVGTAVGFSPSIFVGVENFDGSVIVPPGGLWILVAGATPVAHSAMSGLVWEEVAA